ncbi:MAG: hypothetical protein NVSMB59_23160 [Vulcanimicrobiaceae bacterium]
MSFAGQRVCNFCMRTPPRYCTSCGGCEKCCEPFAERKAKLAMELSFNELRHSEKIFVPK